MRRGPLGPGRTREGLRCATRAGVGLLFCLLALSCASRPSTTPLGEGPLAKKERVERERQSLKRERAERKRRLAELEIEANEAEAARSVEVTFDWDWDGGSGDTEGSSEEGETVMPVTADADPDTGAADGGSEESTAERYAGMYVGDDESLYRFGHMPSRRDRDDKAQTRVTEKDEKTLTITPVDSSNGEDICDLEAELSGDTATIGKDQHCFDQEADETSISGTVRRGRASFRKGRMLLDLEIDLSMVVGEDEYEGTLEYHFRGDKRDDK